MKYNDPRDTSSPYIPLENAAAVDARLPVGWDAATEYHRIKRFLPMSPARQKVLDAAISSVLERAMDCIRHAARPVKVEELGWLERPGGELDLDASLEHGFLLQPDNPETLRVQDRSPKEAELVLVMDMSLSMTGEKLALVAVAVAVLQLKLQQSPLGLVAFDSTARVLKRCHETIPVREVIRRVMEVPARGYTNLEAGLKEGLALLREARLPHRAGILMTDGIYNVGWDPSPLAPQFPRLHVIQLGKDAEKNDKGLCRHLASAGRGRYYRAGRYEDLPALAYMLVQDLFR
jgi:Mg-chelatase subunit ChlD